MNDRLYNSILKQIQALKGKPLAQSDMDNLAKIERAIHQARGVSEHFKWCFEVNVEKFGSMIEYIAGAKPFEISTVKENIVLDAGREEIVKLLTGVGGTAYSNTNAKIYVGDNTTAENASQTGVLATTNKAYAGMVTGYPTVSGGVATFQAVFGEDAANFEIRELSVTNGSGVGAIALNRRVSDLGRKAQGTVWNVTATITLLSE